MTPLEQYPGARKLVYLLFWVAGLIIGAISVYVAVATTEPAPSWLKGAQAVLAFLAVPIGYTAAANVTDTTKIAAQQPPDAPAGAFEAGPAAPVPEHTPVAVVPAADVPNDQPDPAELQAYLEQVAADEGVAQGDG